MNWSAQFAHASWRRALSVRFAVIVITLFAAVPNALPSCSAQAMQKGIGVQLPATSSAVAVPDADNASSMMVTVTEDGSAYFGTDRIVPADLPGKIMDGVSRQPGRKLYIKADARATFGSVSKVLEAARTAGIESPILLTAQSASVQPGTVSPPKGLELLIGPSVPSGAETTVVQVLISRLGWPPLEVNDQRIPWTQLKSTFKQLFQNQKDKVVLVKADGSAPFAQVAQVVDVGRSMGAKVVLATTGL